MKKVMFQGVENALPIKGFNIIICLEVIKKKGSPSSFYSLYFYFFYFYSLYSAMVTQRTQHENLDKAVPIPIREK